MRVPYRAQILMCLKAFSYLFIIALLWFFPLVLLKSALKAEVFISIERALELAFPDAESIENKTIILTDDNVESIKKKYRVDIPSRLFSLNIARKDGKITGYSVTDTHTLRTKSQTIMVILNPDGHLNYVEILAFYEPPEYKTSGRWLDLFRNKGINDDLRSGHDIPNISGATISSHGTSEAVRRVLAIFDYYIKNEAIN